MRLFPFGPLNAEKPGVVWEGAQRLDVSAFGEDYDERFFGTRASSVCARGVDNTPAPVRAFSTKLAWLRP